MPAVALSRVGARMVESGPGAVDLAAGAWQRLEALPGPRSPRGRIYPLACLVAVAVCAFTAAGNDRFTAVVQWIRRAGQADLARLRAPWDPVAGRYRAPDEKTIRVVLDRLDPRALTRALLGPRPRGRQPRVGPSPVSVRGYRARQAAQQAQALARDRLRAVAVDGKTCRGAPPRRRHQGPPPRRRRARRTPPGPSRSRRQAQRDQPLHRAPGIPGPGRCRSDLRRPAHRAGEPELAGQGQ
jgi:DDE_Tnp_1-associated